MANRALQGDDADLELNLTSMMDVCFNLIIFFMIITDMSQKNFAQLTLPTATQDKEDKDPKKDVRVIVNIAKKPDPNNHDNPTAYWRPGDPVIIQVKGRTLTIKQLTQTLFKYAELKRDMSLKVQPSEVYVLIRCDKDIRWREVQWVMQAAADPDVRIYKIQFATRKHKS